MSEHVDKVDKDEMNSIESAFTEMKRHHPSDNFICPVCHSSLPSKLFAQQFCRGFENGTVNPECKLAKYSRKAD